MIKRFGIYSRNVNKEIKTIMETMRKYVSKYSKSTFYQVETWDTFQVNPFYCFKCHVKMRIKEITYFSSRTGSKNILIKLILISVFFACKNLGLFYFSTCFFYFHIKY